MSILTLIFLTALVIVAFLVFIKDKAATLVLKRKVEKTARVSESAYPPVDIPRAIDQNPHPQTVVETEQTTTIYDASHIKDLPIERK